MKQFEKQTNQGHKVMEMWIYFENGDYAIFDCDIITNEQINWIKRNYKIKRVEYKEKV